MRIKLSFVLIPLAVAGVAAAGSLATASGDAWYDTLAQPALTPPGWVFGVVWTALFILAALALILVWNRHPRGGRFRLIITLFLINGALNVLWSFLFFAWHFVGWAIIDAAALALTAYALIALMWKRTPVAAGLLLPYALWVTFAVYLNWAVWMLN